MHHWFKASELIKLSSLLLMIKAAFKIAGATLAEIYLGYIEHTVQNNYCYS